MLLWLQREIDENERRRKFELQKLKVESDYTQHAFL